MPWFDPPATGLETSSWIFPGGIPNKHLVGQWPHPNTVRTSSRFYLETTTPLRHTASRHLFHWQLSQSIDEPTWPNWIEFGEGDWEVVSPNFLTAESNTNSFGWVAKIDIEFFDSLPADGGPGIRVISRLDHSASGHFAICTWEYVEDTNPWKYDHDIGFTADPRLSVQLSVGFPYVSQDFVDYAMSDCFLFPRAAAGPTAFAAFNNLDASVIFDGFTTNTSNQWKLQFDIRLRDTDDCCVLGRTNHSSRRALISSTRFLWFSVGTTIDPPLPLNEFGTVRVEWDWDTPGLFFRVYWNDVLRGTEPAFFANGLRFNVMGKSGATFVGDFDMLNLTLEDNNPGSPNLMLSTELQVDACDIGVNMLKGTTENMTLASCP